MALGARREVRDRQGQEQWAEGASLGRWSGASYLQNRILGEEGTGSGPSNRCHRDHQAG